MCSKMKNFYLDKKTLIFVYLRLNVHFSQMQIQMVILSQNPFFKCCYTNLNNHKNWYSNSINTNSMAKNAHHSTPILKLKYVVVYIDFHEANSMPNWIYSCSQIGQEYTIDIN